MTSEKNLSRRDFLKGVLGLGVAAIPGQSEASLPGGERHREESKPFLNEEELRTIKEEGGEIIINELDALVIISKMKNVKNLFLELLRKEMMREIIEFFHITPQDLIIL